MKKLLLFFILSSLLQYPALGLQLTTTLNPETFTVASIPENDLQLTVSYADTEGAAVQRIEMEGGGYWQYLLPITAENLDSGESFFIQQGTEDPSDPGVLIWSFSPASGLLVLRIHEEALDHLETLAVNLFALPGTSPVNDAIWTISLLNSDGSQNHDQTTHEYDINPGVPEELVLVDAAEGIGEDLSGAMQTMFAGNSFPLWVETRDAYNNFIENLDSDDGVTYEWTGESESFNFNPDAPPMWDFYAETAESGQFRVFQEDLESHSVAITVQANPDRADELVFVDHGNPSTAEKIEQDQEFSCDQELVFYVQRLDEYDNVLEYVDPEDIVWDAGYEDYLSIFSLSSHVLLQFDHPVQSLTVTGSESGQAGQLHIQITTGQADRWVVRENLEVVDQVDAVAGEVLSGYDIHAVDADSNQVDPPGSLPQWTFSGVTASEGYELTGTGLALSPVSLSRAPDEGALSISGHGLQGAATVSVALGESESIVASLSSHEYQTFEEMTVFAGVDTVELWPMELDVESNVTDSQPTGVIWDVGPFLPDDFEEPEAPGDPLVFTPSQPGQTGVITPEKGNLQSVPSGSLRVLGLVSDNMRTELEHNPVSGGVDTLSFRVRNLSDYSASDLSVSPEFSPSGSVVSEEPINNPDELSAGSQTRLEYRVTYADDVTGTIQVQAVGSAEVNGITVPVIWRDPTYTIELETPPELTATNLSPEEVTEGYAIDDAEQGWSFELQNLAASSPVTFQVSSSAVRIIDANLEIIDTVPMQVLPALTGSGAVTCYTEQYAVDLSDGEYTLQLVYNGECGGTSFEQKTLSIGTLTVWNAPVLDASEVWASDIPSGYTPGFELGIDLQLSLDDDVPNQSEFRLTDSPAPVLVLQHPVDSELDAFYPAGTDVEGERIGLTLPPVPLTHTISRSSAEPNDFVGSLALIVNGYVAPDSLLERTIVLAESFPVSAPIDYAMDVHTTDLVVGRPGEIEVEITPAAGSAEFSIDPGGTTLSLSHGSLGDISPSAPGSQTQVPADGLTLVFPVEILTDFNLNLAQLSVDVELQLDVVGPYSGLERTAGPSVAGTLNLHHAVEPVLSDYTPESSLSGTFDTMELTVLNNSEHETLTIQSGASITIGTSGSLSHGSSVTLDPQEETVMVFTGTVVLTAGTYPLTLEWEWTDEYGFEYGESNVPVGNLYIASAPSFTWSGFDPDIVTIGASSNHTYQLTVSPSDVAIVLDRALSHVRIMQGASEVDQVLVISDQGPITGSGTIQLDDYSYSVDLDAGEYTVKCVVGGTAGGVPFDPVELDLSYPLMVHAPPVPEASQADEQNAVLGIVPGFTTDLTVDVTLPSGQYYSPVTLGVRQTIFLAFPDPDPGDPLDQFVQFELTDPPTTSGLTLSTDNPQSMTFRVDASQAQALGHTDQTDTLKLRIRGTAAGGVPVDELIVLEEAFTIDNPVEYSVGEPANLEVMTRLHRELTYTLTKTSESPDFRVLLPACSLDVGAVDRFGSTSTGEVVLTDESPSVDLEFDFFTDSFPGGANPRSLITSLDVQVEELWQDSVRTMSGAVSPLQLYRQVTSSYVGLSREEGLIDTDYPVSGETLSVLLEFGDLQQGIELLRCDVLVDGQVLSMAAPTMAVAADAGTVEIALDGTLNLATAQTHAVEVQLEWETDQGDTDGDTLTTADGFTTWDAPTFAVSSLSPYEHTMGGSTDDFTCLLTVGNKSFSDELDITATLLRFDPALQQALNGPTSIDQTTTLTFEGTGFTTGNGWNAGGYGAEVRLAYEVFNTPVEEVVSFEDSFVLYDQPLISLSPGDGTFPVGVTPEFGVNGSIQLVQPSNQYRSSLTINDPSEVYLFIDPPEGSGSHDFTLTPAGNPSFPLALNADSNPTEPLHFSIGNSDSFSWLPVDFENTLFVHVAGECIGGLPYETDVLVRNPFLIDKFVEPIAASDPGEGDTIIAGVVDTLHVPIFPKAGTAPFWIHPDECTLENSTGMLASGLYLPSYADSILVSTDSARTLSFIHTFTGEFSGDETVTKNYWFALSISDTINHVKNQNRRLPKTGAFAIKLHQPAQLSLVSIDPDSIVSGKSHTAWTIEIENSSPTVPAYMDSIGLYIGDQQIEFDLSNAGPVTDLASFHSESSVLPDTAGNHPISYQLAWHMVSGPADATDSLRWEEKDMVVISQPDLVIHQIRRYDPDDPTTSFALPGTDPVIISGDTWVPKLDMSLVAQEEDKPIDVMRAMVPRFRIHQETEVYEFAGADSLHLGEVTRTLDFDAVGPDQPAIGEEIENLTLSVSLAGFYNVLESFTVDTLWPAESQDIDLELRSYPLPNLSGISFSDSWTILPGDSIRVEIVVTNTGNTAAPIVIDPETLNLAFSQEDAPLDVHFRLTSSSNHVELDADQSTTLHATILTTADIPSGFIDVVPSVSYTVPDAVQLARIGNISSETTSFYVFPQPAWTVDPDREDYPDIVTLVQEEILLEFFAEVDDPTDSEFRENLIPSIEEWELHLAWNDGTSLTLDEDYSWDNSTLPTNELEHGQLQEYEVPLTLSLDPETLPNQHESGYLRLTIHAEFQYGEDGRTIEADHTFNQAILIQAEPEAVVHTAGMNVGTLTSGAALSIDQGVTFSLELENSGTAGMFILPDELESAIESALNQHSDTDWQLNYVGDSEDSLVVRGGVVQNAVYQVATTNPIVPELDTYTGLTFQLPFYDINRSSEGNNVSFDTLIPTIGTFAIYPPQHLTVDSIEWPVVSDAQAGDSADVNFTLQVATGIAYEDVTWSFFDTHTADTLAEGMFHPSNLPQTGSATAFIQTGTRFVIPDDADELLHSMEFHWNGTTVSPPERSIQRSVEAGTLQVYAAPSLDLTLEPSNETSRGVVHDDTEIILNVTAQSVRLQPGLDDPLPDPCLLNPHRAVFTFHDLETGDTLSGWHWEAAGTDADTLVADEAVTFQFVITHTGEGPTNGESGEITTRLRWAGVQVSSGLTIEAMVEDASLFMMQQAVDALEVRISVHPDSFPNYSPETDSLYANFGQSGTLYVTVEHTDEHAEPVESIVLHVGCPNSNVQDTLIDLTGDPAYGDSVTYTLENFRFLALDEDGGVAGRRMSREGSHSDPQGFTGIRTTLRSGRASRDHHLTPGEISDLQESRSTISPKNELDEISTAVSAQIRQTAGTVSGLTYRPAESEDQLPTLLQQASALRIEVFTDPPYNTENHLLRMIGSEFVLNVRFNEVGESELIYENSSAQVNFTSDVLSWVSDPMDLSEISPGEIISAPMRCDGITDSTAVEIQITQPPTDRNTGMGCSDYDSTDHVRLEIKDPEYVPREFIVEPSSSLVTSQAARVIVQKPQFNTDLVHSTEVRYELVAEIEADSLLFPQHFQTVFFEETADSIEFVLTTIDTLLHPGPVQFELHPSHRFTFLNDAGGDAAWVEDDIVSGSVELYQRPSSLPFLENISSTVQGREQQDEFSVGQTVKITIDPNIEPGSVEILDRPWYNVTISPDWLTDTISDTVWLSAPASADTNTFYIPIPEDMEPGDEFQHAVMFEFHNPPLMTNLDVETPITIQPESLTAGLTIVPRASVETLLTARESTIFNGDSLSFFTRIEHRGGPLDFDPDTVVFKLVSPAFSAGQEPTLAVRRVEQNLQLPVTIFLDTLQARASVPFYWELEAGDRLLDSLSHTPIALHSDTMEIDVFPISMPKLSQLTLSVKDSTRFLLRAEAQIYNGHNDAPCIIRLSDTLFNFYLDSSETALPVDTTNTACIMQERTNASLGGELTIASGDTGIYFVDFYLSPFLSPARDSLTVRIDTSSDSLLKFQFGDQFEEVLGLDSVRAATINVRSPVAEYLSLQKERPASDTLALENEDTLVIKFSRPVWITSIDEMNLLRPEQPLLLGIQGTKPDLYVQKMEWSHYEEEVRFQEGTDSLQNLSADYLHLVLNMPADYPLLYRGRPLPQVHPARWVINPDLPLHAFLSRHNVPLFHPAGQDTATWFLGIGCANDTSAPWIDPRRSGRARLTEDPELLEEIYLHIRDDGGDDGYFNGVDRNGIEVAFKRTGDSFGKRKSMLSMSDQTEPVYT
ncbi:hypothetical protein GF324_05645, partial [bacterium]|nr:hypothetical protein [bacterium]